MTFVAPIGTRALAVSLIQALKNLTVCLSFLCQFSAMASRSETSFFINLVVLSNSVVFGARFTCYPLRFFTKASVNIISIQYPSYCVCVCVYFVVFSYCLLLILGFYELYETIVYKYFLSMIHLGKPLIH